MERSDDLGGRQTTNGDGVTGRLEGVVLRSRFVELVEAAEGVEIIGVDMPIGLLADGWRDCDIEVRAFLGARRSSVFLVPPRPVLEAATELVTESPGCRRS